MQTSIEPQIHYLAMKTARANIRGDRLVIKVPKQWPKRLQLRAIEQLTDWAQRHLARTDRQDWHEIEPGPTHTVESLTELVYQINAETYQVDVAKVRIGRAKYSRLAQANIRTRTLTFSRFAIDGMPESALRYLITHELAHFLEANHSSRFWAHVARFIPEWQVQRKLAQDYQELRVRQEDRIGAAQPVVPVSPPTPAPVVSAPLQLSLW
ncbi:MAG: M48 family metallopeptidase [Candidatus Sericytochromatia bacterium]|nr:M48 family metallopeptidase [Candidatus Sericytochromatia bacterium]